MRKDLLRQLTEGKLTEYPRDYLDFNFSRTILGYMNVLIQQRGRRALLFHSVPCPCVAVNEQGGSGYPSPNCVSCGGYGIYFLHDKPHELRALVSSTNMVEGDTRGSAPLQSGTVSITVPSEYNLSSGDKFVFPDMKVPVPLLRRYKAVDEGIPVPFAIVDVEDMVTKYDDPSSPVLNMERGKDYTIDIENRKIAIPSGSVLTDNMVVSLSAIVIPEYIIETVNHANRQILTSHSDEKAKVLNLPKNCTATRSDLFFGQRVQYSKSAD